MHLSFLCWLTFLRNPEVQSIILQCNRHTLLQVDLLSSHLISMFLKLQETHWIFPENSWGDHLEWHFVNCKEDDVITAYNGIMGWWYVQYLEVKSLCAIRYNIATDWNAFIAVIHVPSYESVSRKFHSKWALSIGLSWLVPTFEGEAWSGFQLE